MAKLKEAPKPGSDVYTGLLGLSLAAMVVGCLLLALDLNSYGERQPPQLPALTVPKTVTTTPAPGVPVERKEEPAPAPEKKEGTFRMPEPTLPTPLPALTSAPAALPILPELTRVDTNVIPAIALEPIPAKPVGNEGPPLGVTPFQIPK